MKKLLLSLILVAGLAAVFTSCDNANGNGESSSHATFTLGETTYDVENAITIENIQYQTEDTFNAIVLSEGEMIGDDGGEGRGVVIIFKDNFVAGTHNISPNDDVYPKYLVTNLQVDDIVNFDEQELLQQQDVYLASTGSFTLQMDGNKFTITTDGIEVDKYGLDENNNPIVVETTTSSIDFEGKMSRYVLATVLEGTLSSGDETAPIVTAGRMSTQLPILGTQNLTSFISENGEMLAFVYSGDEVPTGEIGQPWLMLINEMNIDDPTLAHTGHLSVNIVEEDGETYYVVDITDACFTINDVTTHYNMHYKGTLPFFDFPF